MITLNGLPLNKAITTSEGYLEKVWLQEVGAIGDSLKGRWGYVPEGDLVVSGLTYDTADYSLELQGKTLVVSIVFTGLNSTSATIDFSAIKFLPKPSVLTVHSGNNWVVTDGIYIDSAVINLPDTSGNLAITGTLIRS